MKFNLWLNQVNIEVDSGWGRGHPANCPVGMSEARMRYSYPAIHATTQQQVADNRSSVSESDAPSLFECISGSIVVSERQ